MESDSDWAHDLPKIFKQREKESELIITRFGPLWFFPSMFADKYKSAIHLSLINALKKELLRIEKII